ncbi:hypothetical protein EB229_32945 [Mesorhizobium jarvisii]|nr:hypothetical protein A9174_32230 [Mesorhizobium loti NZP2037]OBP77967.1 hypothetical protein BAE41_30920 [Mesorhizobium loti]OBP96980.1 hypothetical protein BAE38_27240 [Mesorhizobium loti]OBQ73558.1 hypothetical protein A9K72_31135 [Mesorhizobium loti]QKC66481.1 hypothetical protein EB229_32945 [Mesorhizobium jarvisii]
MISTGVLTIASADSLHDPFGGLLQSVLKLAKRLLDAVGDLDYRTKGRTALGAALAKAITRSSPENRSRGKFLAEWPRLVGR